MKSLDKDFFRRGFLKDVLNHEELKLMLIVSFIIVLFCSPAISQDQQKEAILDFEKLHKKNLSEYGYDQVLVNGVLYEDKYRKKFGHQFLFEDKSYKGNLVFRGKAYTGIEMKYDVYEQQLILCLKNDNSIMWVVPPNDFVSSFSIYGKYFSKCSKIHEPGFTQVIFDGEKLKCYYYWFKEREDSDKTNFLDYSEFSKAKRRNYVIINDVSVSYKNNRSFTKTFPDEVRGGVREFIKDNNIKVDKANDKEIENLLTYCNSLL